MNQCAPVTVIEIRFEFSDGYLTVSSADVPGLNLCSTDHAAVIQDVIPAIKALFKHNRGIDVRGGPRDRHQSFP